MSEAKVYPWPDRPEGEHEMSDPEEGERERSSWWPMKLGPFLDGSYAPPQPTIGRRADGRGLFYPGRDHTVISESEGGKTWLALLACQDEIRADRHVAYVDFEGDAGSLVDRLLMTGCSRDALRERFHYVRPGERLVDRDLADLIQDTAPSMVVLDGITEGMSLQGLNPLDNFDVARWRQMLTSKVMRLGPAVVSLDHVTKSAEGRGRYALGGVHKINGLDGAAYVLENRQPFGRGLTGRSTLRIAKDRHGQLRANGLPSREGMYWYGDLVVRTEDDQYAEVTVEPPHEQDEGWQPTGLMQKIAEELGKAAQPLSQRSVLELVKGKNDTKRQAFHRLIADGYVSQKSPHTLLKPFDLDPQDD